ncbi:CCHC-type domain-containing protein [Durusdinium trenchii]|uniref:CCHC-type domain-containing protein n=1 Tax=Durusdinium trenchii TaxID=1381693 RepID=A0ABP0HIT1_9DINO
MPWGTATSAGAADGGGGDGDEKKRIIVDNKGILTYDATRDAMRLLGSRFFQDLQGGGTKKWKTYDVHSVDEQEPTYAAVSRPTEMATMAEDFSHENPSELPEDLPDGIQETFQKYFTCLTVDPIPKERDELSSETHLACERAHEGMLRGLVGRDSVDECLVVFDGREFKRKLSSALNNVARQRNEQMSRRSAGPPQAKSLSQPFSINQASLTSCKTNVAEETSGEAILDTGASRTIIGSDRVPGLIEALKGIEVQRGPSRCVFRFGNSGLLHSEEALFLKRFGKGWLRVEIVPGSTPFLISNAVLEGMRGILDVHEGVMRFHGSEDHLKLRQNVLGSLVHCMGIKMQPSSEIKIIRRLVRARTRRLMALKKTIPQYQLETLSGDEDEGLVQTSHQPHTYTYKVPTGIQNLHQWGVETFQSGKHKGKTFQEVYDLDSSYAQFILHNTRLTSRDMLSFQNFIKAHKKMLAREMLQRPIPPKTTAHRLSAMSSGVVPKKNAKNQGQAMSSEAEWSLGEDETSLSGPKMSPEALKRGYAQTSPSSPMQWTGDQQKVQELQTQIAILQRELAQHVPQQTDQPEVP